MFLTFFPSYLYVFNPVFFIHYISMHILYHVQPCNTSEFPQSYIHLGMVTTYHFTVQVIDILVHCYHWPSGGLLWRIIFASNRA